jgi:oligosaccharyltransferase complex subunit beta
MSEKNNLLIALSPKQTLLTSLATEFTPSFCHPQRLHLSHTIPFALSAQLQSLSISHPRLLSLLQAFQFGSPVPHMHSATMLVPILRAPAESFAADSTDDSGADGIVDATEKGGKGLWAGSQMALVTGFQTNVNSRVVFAGGIDLLSDEYARKELPSGTPSGNSQLARDIAA